MATRPSRNCNQWADDRESLLKLEAWSRDGLTQAEIAKNIGISRNELFTWRKERKEIDIALHKGREVTDIVVENALYKKAQGYNVSLQKTMKIKKAEYDPITGKKVAEYEELVPAIEEIHVPADTQADIFWLKNRKPLNWREKQDISVTGDIGVSLIIKDDYGKNE